MKVLNKEERTNTIIIAEPPIAGYDDVFDNPTMKRIPVEGDEEEPNDVLNLKAAREQADRRVIRHALARSEGNISSTAKMLGISRPTLYDLLKQYDLHA